MEMTAPTRLRTGLLRLQSRRNMVLGEVCGCFFAVHSFPLLSLNRQQCDRRGVLCRVDTEATHQEHDLTGFGEPE